MSEEITIDMKVSRMTQLLRSRRAEIKRLKTLDRSDYITSRIDYLNKRIVKNIEWINSQKVLA